LILITAVMGVVEDDAVLLGFDDSWATCLSEGEEPPAGVGAELLAFSYYCVP